MTTPRFLIGATLIFWGWQTDFLIAGAIMAVILESAGFIKARWELTNEDFSRVWTFCTLLFLGTAVYGFTAGNGFSKVGQLIASGSLSAQNGVGNATAKTAVLLIRWLPMSFFLFIAAQVFSDREGIPLETVSMILRRRWRKAAKAGRPSPGARTVNMAYPYFIACLFAASSHPLQEDNGFFWGLCLLLAWALWPFRSRRFGLALWASAIAAAILLGFAGQQNLVRLKQGLDVYNARWLASFMHHGFDPLETRTELGQIGRIKTSGRIVLRLETPNGGSPPPYLREAAYRIYKAPVWYAGSSKDDFTTVLEKPANSGTWPLLPDKTNVNVVNIACYLPDGKALLPLPSDAGELTQLPAFLLQKNSVGAVLAEGPGLVIFNALYGPGAAIDYPPDTNEDLTVPEREKAALDRVISEQHLSGLNREQKLQAVAHFFGTEFTYSLWQQRRKVRETNSTALSRFLLKTRSGHCEYFATATVLLLRELDIPARYTVGYAVHENSGVNYVVRQSDAHAWCRAWNDQKQKWEDFDTTPGTWAAMEHEQRSVFQPLSDAWSRVVFEFSKFRWGQGQLRQYILWALVPVLALLLYQIFFRSGKRRKPKVTGAGLETIFRPGLDSEFYQLESELAKRGLARHSNEPLLAWLKRLQSTPGFSQFEEAFLPLINLHYRYRFDPHGLDDQDRELLRREAADCLLRIELIK